MLRRLNRLETLLNVDRPLAWKKFQRLFRFPHAQMLAKLSLMETTGVLLQVDDSSCPVGYAAVESNEGKRLALPYRLRVAS